jgi:8-oxo-dGTP pyrophosphatase MutT (NUDIX family)
MKQGQVRSIAICIIRDKDRIFVGEHYDFSKKETFYRPLGGAIEFGEYGRECVVREVREEAEKEIKDLVYMGMIENIFVYHDKPEHEIVLIFQANFADSHMYEVSSIKCRNNGEEFDALWKPLSDFGEGKDPLYPEGLLDMLDRKK